MWYTLQAGTQLNSLYAPLLTVHYQSYRVQVYSSAIVNLLGELQHLGGTTMSVALSMGVPIFWCSTMWLPQSTIWDTPPLRPPKRCSLRHGCPTGSGEIIPPTLTLDTIRGGGSLKQSRLRRERGPLGDILIGKYLVVPGRDHL